MESWIGFTDDELRRLKRENSTTRPNHGRPTTSGARAPPRTRAMVTGRQKSDVNENAKDSNNLPASMRLSQALPPESQHVPSHASASNPQTVDDKTQGEDKTNSSGVQDVNIAIADQQASKLEAKIPQENNMVKELDTEEVIKREYSNVEKFQFQQKVIEEQNKKKRQLLAAAIVDRQQKAKQEASRLIRIQKELAQLDHLLAVDVSIIRNKIEDISREFMEAQRRYDRAEQEFIAAKIDLHQKSGLKESLTEHLHTIIHQNEVRKARKLTELMEKLSMQDDGGDDEEDVKSLEATIPSMCTLSAIQNQAQEPFYRRAHRTSSESDKTVSHTDSNTEPKRSLSHDGKSSGITGWLTGWLGGKPSMDKAATAEEAEVHTDSSRGSVVVTEPTAIPSLITGETQSSRSVATVQGYQDESPPKKSSLESDMVQTLSLSKPAEQSTDHVISESQSDDSNKAIITADKNQEIVALPGVKSVEKIQDNSNNKLDIDVVENVDHNKNIESKENKEEVPKVLSESIDT